jgi:3D (Asp-Asp-Asp) domain-containing protein
MLYVKKHAAWRLAVVMVLTFAAIFILGLTIGRNVDAYEELLSESDETALTIAATINNTLPPATGENFAVTSSDPVTQRTSTTVETIPYSIVYQEDDTIDIGTEILITEGVDGQRISNTLRTYVDGRLKTFEVISEQITAPIDKVIVVGTRDRNLPETEDMISELEIPEWFALDENGVPTSYESVLTGKGVAYSAYPGAKTASGRYAVPGMVAVDPSIIPYGTELYIASTDNDHIYGYAIAADTGTGLLEGLCLVDLYMNTYEESCDWGAHQVNIYILN